MRKPQSMDELVYMTRRVFSPKGRLMAWAFKKECPQCHKALMGKPVEKGKVRIRATEYVCPACGYTESLSDHEKTLSVCVEYECPSCSYTGEVEIPYVRKSWQGVKAFVFACQGCGEKIGVTKKLAEPKKKK